MKKIVISLLVIVMVALGAVSLVGCEKSLDGTYVDQSSSACTIVIEGNKIKFCWTLSGKTTVDDEGTFTRKGDILTTTLTKYVAWKELTITKDGNLTNPDKLGNGEDVISTYVKVKAK